MSILNLKDFMEKYKLKKNTMNERDLQRTHNYNMYPRDSKISSDKMFLNIDNGSMGGSHWTYFMVKDNKSYYFDSFGDQPEKFLLKQLHKPAKDHNY